MADKHYAQFKNQESSAPSGSIDLGSPTSKIGNIFMSGNLTIGNTVATETLLIVPKISSVSIAGGASAASPAGGETITVTGSGFLPGISAYVANTVVGSTTLVSNTQVTFSSPVQVAGSYALSVVNADGASAVYVPGLTYSALPAWGTSAGSLGTGNIGDTINITLSASENAQTITYALTSGSLPAGLSLSSSGVLSGTLSTVAGTTTSNFTVTATDPQNQKTSQNFSYTVLFVYPTATGGTITTSGNYKIHRFTSSGTFTPSGAMTADVLIVAGGGGGGAVSGGGGGAGGLLYSTSVSLSGTAYTVTIGGGGTGSPNTSGPGTQGGNTVFNGSTAVGGGGGASNGPAAPAGNGGSGGGGSRFGQPSGGKGIYPGSSYLSQARQGYDGGPGDSVAGGGGGAGGAGGTNNSSNGTLGGSGAGAGASNSITGASVTYSTGGQAWDTTHPINNASSNTGNGGNGASNNNGGNNGANGGSGVVIIKYQFQ